MGTDWVLTISGVPSITSTDLVFWGDLGKSEAVFGALSEDIRDAQNSALAIYIAKYFLSKYFHIK